MNIHWLVHYLPHGNTDNIHFADDSSRLTETASENKHES